MAVVDESITTTLQATNSTTVVANMPGTRPDDDLYVAICNKDGDALGGNEITAPGGWTRFTPANLGDASSNVSMAAFWRIGSSEPSTYTFSADSQEWVVHMLRFSGMDSTTPIPSGTVGASQSSGTSNRNAVAPSVSGLNDIASDMIIRATVHNNASPYSTNAGYGEAPTTTPQKTSIGQGQSSGASSTACSAAVSKDDSPVDPTLSAIHRNNVTEQWVALTFVVQAPVASASLLLMQQMNQYEGGTL